MAAGEPVLIGIDVGTSSVKAVMAAPGGLRLDSYSAPHGTRRTAPGMAEQDPGDWRRHVEAALARFAGHPRAGDVRVIGITSQVNTHLFCDTARAPLAPAITWQDTRAAPEAAALDARISPDDKIAALGAPIPIDASHALSRMAWMATHHPEDWARTRHVLLPKDWIIAQLTGQVGADPLSAVGLAGADLAYAAPVLDLVPRAAEVLPPLRDPLQVAGPVLAGPFRGVPVATGTMDAWAAMFGLGVSGEGEATYLSGTSEVLGLISNLRQAEPGIIVFPEWRGITLHAGPTQSGGASLDWLGRLLGQDTGRLDALAAGATISASSPLFLPHLEGERAPIWDPSSRGAFAGLSGATGPAELVACVMEGVAFSARLALEAVERSGAHRVSRLSLGGGGAASPVWNTIRADALGRTITPITTPEPGASGALAMAGVAAGVLPDLAAATRALTVAGADIAPDPARAATSAERFARYRELYAALRPLHHGMA
jgi:xylulokinase